MHSSITIQSIEERLCRKLELELINTFLCGADRGKGILITDVKRYGCAHFGSNQVPFGCSLATTLV